MKKFGITTYFGVKNDKTLSENLDFLKSLGFTEISEGLDYVNYPLEELCRFTKEKGMTIGSFHARYKLQDQTALFRNDYSAERYIESLKEDISKCSKYNVKKLVVHLDKSEVFNWQILFKNFKILLKFAEKKNVILCVENLKLFTVDDVDKLLQKFNSPYLKVCFDVGHFNAFEENKNLDRIINDKLFLNNISFTHIHGNYGKSDEHLPLRYSNIDKKKLKELFDLIPEVAITSETLHSSFLNVSYEDHAKEIMEGLKLLN